MTFDGPPIFERARQKGDIARESGVAAGRRGKCPMCGDAKHKTDFSHRKGGFWKCFRGCGQGDVITLVASMKGFDKLTAARFILDLPLDGSGDHAGQAKPESDADRRRRERDREARQRKAMRSAEASAAYHARVMEEMDGTSRPAVLSAGVTTWLRDARGLPVAWLADAIDRLKACSNALYAEDFDTGDIERHPAMLAEIEDCITGEIVGRHVTYLARSGRAKADVDAGRKIWGSARGGVWLTDRKPELGPLFVGEGIETVLSLLAAWRMSRKEASGRALAVLSLDNLQGHWMTDRLGRMDPDRVRPDSARPAIAWAKMGQVIIGPDNDMRPIPVKVRLPDGKTGERMIDQARRMEISGVLAAHWWRRAGATSVSIARPPAGMDFNDALMAPDDERAA